MAEQATTTSLKLPERIIGSMDLSRVLRELKAVDDWLNQAALRKTGEAMKLPKASQSLEEVAAINGVSLLEAKQREQLIAILEAFRLHAPRLHMTFAVEPNAKVTSTVIGWLRGNVNPLVLLEVGLQPTIAAGCMVRTTNKFFDLSLRNHFRDNRHLLVEKIAMVDEKVRTETPAVPEPAVPQPAVSIPAPVAPAVPPVAPPPTPAVAAPSPAPVSPAEGAKP